jgi:hypothetical protein
MGWTGLVNIRGIVIPMKNKTRYEYNAVRSSSEWLYAIGIS